MKKQINKKKLLLIFAVPLAIVVFLFIVGLLSNLGQGNKLQIGNLSAPKKTEEIRKLNPIAITKENLIGIWHECPSMPSVWCDHYNFYPSGKFRFYANGRNCSGTKVDEIGLWELNGSQLKLTINASGPCGTGQNSIYAIPEFKVLTTPKIKTYILKPVNEPVTWGGYTYQLNEMFYSAIFVDSKPFWKFNEDPVGNGEFPENYTDITLVWATKLAEMELKKRNYPFSLEKYFIESNGKNTSWNEYLASGPTGFRDKTLKDLKLENRNYWAIHFAPIDKNTLGGDAWVFVDRDNGSIIGTILGQ